jgi:hypothetical protein
MVDTSFFLPGLAVGGQRTSYSHDRSFWLWPPDPTGNRRWSLVTVDLVYDG